MKESLLRLTRLSRALSGRDKRLYQDFMKAIELLERCDRFRHNCDLDKDMAVFLKQAKAYWPILEMRDGKI